MPAFFIPGVDCSGPARDIKEFARINPGKLWKSCASNQNGRPGAVAFIGEQPSYNSPGWTDCGDGMWYLPGRPLPAQVDLVRERKVDGIEYVTSAGVTLTIPIASAAPRQILFSAKKAGDHSGRFALNAFALFDKLQTGEIASVFDPAVIDVIMQALSEVYYLTPELLDELKWINSSDVDGILMCIMGANPKDQTPAGGSLPSPVGA